jgi:transcriptional regulator with XRE-family HTH domain
VIDMELLSVIRRWHYRDHFSIREISRRTGLSRNTVRKYLRSDSEEPKFSVPDRPSRLDPHADKLSHMLRQEAGKSRKQKRTIKQLHADLVVLGYEGSYNRVAAFNKQRSVPSRKWKPEEIKETATRATQEYLATLDNAAFGAASPVTPKFISRSDPAAQWTGAHKGHAFFAYANNYLIDTDHGVIVDVEATRAIRQAEVGAARTMLERTETRFGIKPAFLAADSAYGSEESLAWLVKRKEIAPHIPVFDKSSRTDGTFSRADFAFDAERDRYTCPAGKELVQFRRTYATPRSGITAEGTRIYRASKLDCDVCKLKAQCCPKALARKIPRDLDEDARDVARAHAATPQYVEACRRRKKVEMLFAHLKRILRLTRLRLRGPNGARDEFLLAAVAQNLRRLARLRPTIESLDASPA